MIREIYEKITQSRKVMSDVNVFHGYDHVNGDAAAFSEPVVAFKNYIVEGRGDSEKEAISEFLSDLERQDIPNAGDILWRVNPEIRREHDYDHDAERYVVSARFSIKGVSE